MIYPSTSASLAWLPSPAFMRSEGAGCCGFAWPWLDGEACALVAESIGASSVVPSSSPFGCSSVSMSLAMAAAGGGSAGG
eukprot:1143406-Pelagomonas_calceolata.AAC.9